MFKNFLEHLDNIHQIVKVEIIAFLLLLVVPIISALWLMGLLIIADTLTGIWAAYNEKGWQAIKSRPFSDGVLPKITMYPLALLIASGCEYSFNSIPFIKSTLFILMCIELKSLTENFKVILKINIFNFVKILILKGKKGLIEELEKTDNKK